MEGRRGMKGRKIRIEDDLTWKERRMEWRIKEIARQERGRGKGVWKRLREDLNKWELVEMGGK